MFVLYSIPSYKHIYFTSTEKQVFTIYTNVSRFCVLGSTPGLAQNVWAYENPKDNTSSWGSNSGPYDCEAYALPHDHGHHLFVAGELEIVSCSSISSTDR